MRKPALSTLQINNNNNNGTPTKCWQRSHYFLTTEAIDGIDICDDHVVVGATLLRQRKNGTRHKLGLISPIRKGVGQPYGVDKFTFPVINGVPEIQIRFHTLGEIRLDMFSQDGRLVWSGCVLVMSYNWTDKSSINLDGKLDQLKGIGHVLVDRLGHLTVRQFAELEVEDVEALHPRICRKHCKVTASDLKEMWENCKALVQRTRQEHAVSQEAEKQPQQVHQQSSLVSPPSSPTSWLVSPPSSLVSPPSSPTSSLVPLSSSPTLSLVPPPSSSTSSLVPPSSPPTASPTQLEQPCGSPQQWNEVEITNLDWFDALDDTNDAASNASTEAMCSVLAENIDPLRVRFESPEQRCLFDWE